MAGFRRQKMQQAVREATRQVLEVVFPAAPHARAQPQTPIDSAPSAPQPMPQPSPDPSTAPRLLRDSLCRIPAQQRAAAQTPHFCH
jgi:hypothetical protein